MPCSRGLVPQVAARARRDASFYAFVVACLAIGIGTATAVFAVVDATLFRPLAFPEAHRLASLATVTEQISGDTLVHAVSPAVFVEMRDRSVAFATLEATWNRNFDLAGDHEPIRLSGVRTTPGLFSTLGVRPEAGRMFVEGDVARPVALLSESAWRRYFGADRSVVGSKLELDGLRREIIGIVPSRQAFPVTAEVWVPFHPERVPIPEFHSGGLTVVGRLAAGMTLDAARADMDRVSRFLAELYPANNGGSGTRVTELRNPYVQDVRPVLLALLASVLVFLTTAVVNVAGLFLVRSGRQIREIALKSALGASRTRVLTGAFVEGCAVAVASAVVGSAIALGVVPWLTPSAADSLPPGGVPSLIEPRVVVFAIGVVVVTSLACALGPALTALRALPGSALRGAGRGGSASVHQRRAQKLAVVAQAALGTVLVLSASASVDRLIELRSVEPGFGGGRTISVRIPVSDERFPSREQRSDMVWRIAAELAAVPGVRAAGGSDVLPVGDPNVAWSLSIEDRPPRDPGAIEFASGRLVTPGYLEAAGIAVVRGRSIEPTDRAETVPVAVVSEAFVERYWPGENPIGKRIKRRAYSSPFPWITVVGVAEDVRDGGPAVDQGTTVYFPFTQQVTRTGREISFVIRSDCPHAHLLPEIRARIAAIDPLAPIVRVTTLDALLTESMSVERTSGEVLGGFAVGGLLLLAVGMYGIVSRTVLERRWELGLRRALGAGSAEAVRLVLSSSMLSVAAGTVLGMLVGPLAVGLSGTVLGDALVVPSWAYSFAGVLVLMVGAAASFSPALRAVRVSPLVTLHAE